MSETIARVPRTEQEAAASYTRLSKWYDRLGRSSEGPHIAEGLRLLDVQPGERVLEVGFGTGRSLIALAHAVGSTGQVDRHRSGGGDDRCGARATAQRCYSGVMPECCNRASRWPNGKSCRRQPASATPSAMRGAHGEARGNDVVTLNRGSALHLPYAAASFDAVFSSFMLDLIDTPDIPLVLSEMRRVLKPGGRLSLVSMSKACAGNVIVKVYERFHRWLPRLIDCRPIYLQHAVEAAGLHCEVHHTRSMWGIPVEIVVATK